jgi:hypothetical protein
LKEEPVNSAEYTKISIISIATNEYLDYWFQLASSIETNAVDESNVNLHLFTNDVGRAREWCSNNLRIPVSFYQVENYGWPDATLLRYKVMLSLPIAEISDTVAYLDSDSLIVSKMTLESLPFLDSNSMTLIRHPGYWRPTSLAMFYVKNSRLLFRDMFRIISYGGIGAWEKRRKSNAFVKRKYRKKYFCGGFWYGPRTEFFKMVNVLAETVESDSRNGIVAVWHDESHLNKWASTNPFNSLDPSYCFAEEFHHLRELEAKIVAVKKPSRRDTK